MSEILSQSEIDELLRALASGGADEPPPQKEEKNDDSAIRRYDFRTANKFSREQIRMLHIIHDNYSSRMSTLLSGMLRVPCDAQVISVEELQFGEFSNSLPSPTLLAVFNMTQLAGPGLLEVSSTISYEIISRLFGGKGQYMPETNKPFTEIELAILRRIVQQMLSLTGPSWERVADMSASLERLETSGQFTQIVAASETVVIITINVTIGDVSDVINLCIPHLAIQPIAKLLANKAWYDERVSAEALGKESLPALAPRISNAQVTLKAVFDTTQATVYDVINLQAGDVIRTGHKVTDDLTLLIEHIAKFTCKMGKAGKQAAVRITGIIQDESGEE